MISAPTTLIWTKIRLRATSKSPEIPVVDNQYDDEILSSIPDSHPENDRARDTRRSTDVESHAVSQNKRSSSSSGICRRSYESKVIRPLQNRRKEHDCIKEITDETVTMSSDKSTNECSSLLIPRSSDRSKQKTLDTVDCHSSPSVLLTPSTTQNKLKSSFTMPASTIRHSGEHTIRAIMNSTRYSGENVVTTSQRVSRSNSLLFAKDIQSDSSKSMFNSGSNLTLPNSDPDPLTLTLTLILILILTLKNLIYHLNLISQSLKLNLNLNLKSICLNPI